MKITQIETIPIRLPTRRVHQWASLTTPIGVYVIIKLHTDEGLIGCGETFYIASAAAAIIHDWMAPRLVGANPLDIEGHWRFLL